MAAIRVKLVRSMSGHIQKHRQTLRGLGLSRLNQTRLLPATPATRGMIAQVSYLLEWSEVQEDFKKFGKRATSQR